MTTNRSHVILGGNGITGQETARALLSRGETVASFGRRTSTVTGVRSIVGDLLNASDVSGALTGADVAYLTVGITYSTRAWAQQWPVILGNSIDAAIANNAHLIYLDNVYAYGQVDGPMTEHSPISPDSKKGQIRADALGTLATAASARGLEYTVARSADFYGPGATTSVFNSFAIDKIADGKVATWLYDVDQPHSLTYTPDIGNALAILGTTSRANGEVWHLPTSPALTGREYIRLATGTDAQPKVMTKSAMRIGGLFIKAARESLELSYQNAEPYLFDSSAFEEKFGVEPTPVAVGIAESLSAARSSVTTHRSRE